MIYEKSTKRKASQKITHWRERSKNRVAWEKSIKEEKIHIRMLCCLRIRNGRRRRRRRRRRIAKLYIDV